VTTHPTTPQTTPEGDNVKIPQIGYGRKLREWEKNFNTPLTVEQWESEAEIHFREARRTGNAVYDAHGRIAKLHAERLRRGLKTVTDLPADVLRKWDWEGATATLRAHIH